MNGTFSYKDMIKDPSAALLMVLSLIGPSKSESESVARGKHMREPCDPRLHWLGADRIALTDQGKNIVLEPALQ